MNAKVRELAGSTMSGEEEAGNDRKRGYLLGYLLGVRGASGDSPGEAGSRVAATGARQGGGGNESERGRSRRRPRRPRMRPRTMTAMTTTMRRTRAVASTSGGGVASAVRGSTSCGGLGLVQLELVAFHVPRRTTALRVGRAS
jgi:hypothetical protein